MSLFSKLDELLARKNQRFICIGTGRPKPGAERFCASITHEIAPPADQDELEILREQIPSVPQLTDLYSKYGSIRLYCDSIGEASAFYIASPDEWQELKDYFQDWLEDLDECEEEEILPEWMRQEYIVFGEIPNTGNYLLMPLEGEDVGKVFEFEHDGFEFIEWASDLASFVNKIATVTDALISDIRGHTRYSDGVTDTQWLAEKYLYD